METFEQIKARIDKVKAIIAKANGIELTTTSTTTVEIVETTTTSTTDIIIEDESKQ
jgi:hypothetical protein